MKPIYIIALLCLILSNLNSQVRFNELTNYDTPGGLYDDDSLRTIQIEFYNPNYHDILVSNWEENNGQYLPAKVSFSDGQSFDSVGVRYRGNSTFSIPNNGSNRKLPLNIDLDHYVDGQNYLGYDKIKLANAHFDPSSVKEVSALTVYRQFLPSGESNFMRVNIQGDYIGLYVNLESINKDFLKKHYKNKSGAFFKCDPIQQFGQQVDTNGNSNLMWLGPDTSIYKFSYDKKSDHGWSSFVNMINVMNNDFDNVEDVINMDRVLWAFACNMVITNLDTYNGFYQHNYYMYEDVDGRYQMIPWDMSESFGGIFLSNFSYEALTQYDPFLGLFGPITPLMGKLDADDFYKKLYAAHIRTVLNLGPNATDLQAYAKKSQNLIRPSVEQDGNRIFSTNLFERNVDNNISWFGVVRACGITNSQVSRDSFLRHHPEIMKIPPSVFNHTVEEIGNEFIVTLKVDNGTKAIIKATNDFTSSRFYNFEMKDDGIGADQTAGDGIFSAVLPFSQNANPIKYYFIAENEDALILEPEMAQNEYFIFHPISAPESVVINELQADNTQTVSDEQNEFDDWVELYNRGSQPISLNTFFLSDNKDDLNKWPLPDVIIEPNGYLLIWADNDESQGKLHSNFKLNADGESIYLSSISLGLIDSVNFNFQETDASFGRYPNGSGDFFVMAPTPRSENSLSTAVADFDKNFNVFPNPSQGIVQLNVANAALNLDVVIEDKMGRNVFYKTIQGSAQLDLHHLVAGTYFMTITQGEKTESMKLTIIH